MLIPPMHLSFIPAPAASPLPLPSRTGILLLFAKLKQGKLLGCIVHNHQCALFGKAFHLEDERFFRHGAVHQQAVVDEDGGGVSGKAFRQCDGIGFDEVAVFRFLLLQPHAHVDKDDDYEITAKARMPLPTINCLLVLRRCAIYGWF